MLSTKRIKFFYMGNYFYKVLLSFVVISILATLSISLVFSIIFIKNINEQLETDNIQSINRLSADFDNVFYQARQMNLYLRQSPDIFNFLMSPVTDYYVTNRADLFASGVRNLNPYLFSILLYNRNSEIVIQSGKPGIRIDQFLDRPLLRPRAIGNIQLALVTVHQDIPTVRPNMTLAALFTDTTIANEMENAIIMNIDRDELEKKLFSNYTGLLLVCDDDGRIIFTSDPEMTDLSPAEMPHYNQIVASDSPTGSFKQKIGSKTDIITYSQSVETGLYLVNVRAIGGYAAEIKHKVTTVVLIGICVLSGLLLISFTLTKSIYFPLKKITEKMISAGSAVSRSPISEFAMISKAFDETQAQIKELKYKTAATNGRLKEEILRYLLKKGVPANWEEAVAELNFQIDFTHLYLVCIRIDHYNKLNNSEKFSLETTLAKIIPDLIRTEFRCETVNMFDGEIALLLNYAEREPSDEQALLSGMDKIRFASEQTLQITLTIGIGGRSDRLEGCSEAYDKAVEAAKHRFIVGFNHTIQQRDLDERLATSVIYSEEMEEKLIVAIRLNKKEAFVETLQTIIAHLRDYPYSVTVSILFQMITRCVKTMNQTTSKDNSRHYLNFDEFSSMFADMETLDQVSDWLVNMFDKYRQLLDAISQQKGDKHFKVVEKVQEHIQLHYSAPDLSLESVAEAAGYSSYYFSKIFKEIAGMNVNDYIRQIRINKSKELLCEMENKIQDIAAAVGYANASHFYTLFKKDVGLTPTEYREFITNKGSN